MISILDYGVGNIKAFENALNKLNISYKVVKTKNELIDSKRIVFPGVGSFDNAMNLLNNSGMRDTLDDLVLNKKIPILGVCVGMQMFAKHSDEGIGTGLGWIDAFVKKIPICSNLSIPHMGWNNLKNFIHNPLLDGITNESYFYFLHSYYFHNNDSSAITLNSEYSIDFTSIIIKDNIYGVQFHPEKSHNSGLILLNNFAKNIKC